MKIDIVTWTYNSAKTLTKCLPTIDRAIPRENTCHKIAVDGGSQDNTEDILREHGWQVKEAPKKGIPYQANHALGIVDTKFFASFEHDIILNPNWFERMSRLIGSDETIGAVQGVRLYTGSKTMQAIERWQYRARLIPRWVYSIDNVLYRTEAVKRSGGFSDECMASADGILRKNMFLASYKWITDYALVSGHYRKDFFEQFKHQINAAQLATYVWSSNPESGSLPRRLLSTLGGNPVNVLNMSLQSRMLRVPVAWYILRFEKGLYLSLPHQYKSVKRVAMDDWYLREFQRDVRSSAADIQSNAKNAVKSSCVWCAKQASFIYELPMAWGNILPKLHPRIGPRFAVCSPQHADKVAEKIFKDAFDYVSPN